MAEQKLASQAEQMPLEAPVAGRRLKVFRRDVRKEEVLTPEHSVSFFSWGQVEMRSDRMSQLLSGSLLRPRTFQKRREKER